tara:strand:+ start:233 stop:1774 length:1542 start_codon:yes stop_codon:yes gene_type:complete
MSFAKLISVLMVAVAKSGVDLDLVIATLKEEAIDIAATQIEKQVPIELPFSTREILNGGTLPPNLLSPATLNTAKDLAPPLPEPQRAQIEGVLDGVEGGLDAVIQTLNVVKGTVNTITEPLETINTLGETLNGIISALEITIAIVAEATGPIPLGAPVGVGAPTKFVTGVSDILYKTDQQIEKIKPPLEQIPKAVAIITRILVPIVAQLNLFDPIFQKIIQIVTFVRVLIQPGPATQAGIDATLSSITSNIQESLAVTAGPLESSSNSEANEAANNALLFLLTDGGGVRYKGFTLTLEFDSTNTFSFPARRIKAVRTISANNAFNETGEAFGVTLYSGTSPAQVEGQIDTSGPYSFSSSTQVLVYEVEFNIDQFLREYTKSDEVEEIEEDIPSPTPLTPAQILENLVNEARQSLISRGFTELEAKWIMEESDLLVQNITQQIDNGLTPNEFFKQILINRGFSEGEVNYLISAQSASKWVAYIQQLYPNFSLANIDAVLFIAENVFNLQPYTGS